MSDDSNTKKLTIKKVYVVLCVSIKHKNGKIEKFESYRYCDKRMSEMLRTIGNKDILSRLFKKVMLTDGDAIVKFSVYKDEIQIKKLIKIYGEKLYQGSTDLINKFLSLYVHNQSFQNKVIDLHRNKIFQIIDKQISQEDLEEVNTIFKKLAGGISEDDTKHIYDKLFKISNKIGQIYDKETNNEITNDKLGKILADLIDRSEIKDRYEIYIIKVNKVPLDQFIKMTF